MDLLEEADDMVLEYLLFRGFMETSNCLRREREQDHLHNLSSERVVEELFDFLENFKLRELLEVWNFLHSRFFTRLEDLGQIEALVSLKNGLLRLYLVHAHQNNRVDKVMEFFQQKTVETHCAASGYRDDWRTWYSLPYCNFPEKDAHFAPFFKPEWKKLLRLSLHNFFAQVFRNEPPPSLLAFNIARKEKAALQADNKALELENVDLKKQVEQYHLLLSIRDKVASFEKKQAAEPAVVAAGAVEEEESSRKNVSTSRRERGVSPFELIGTAKHNATVNQCRFSPEVNCVAAASNDSTVRVWNWGQAMAQESLLLEQDQLVFLPGPALSLAWHAEDTHLLAVGTSSASVVVWDHSRRKEATRVVISGEEHTPCVTDVCFCPRRKLLATVSAGQNLIRDSNSSSGKWSSLRLWSISNAQLIQRFDPHNYEITCAQFNHNGSFVVTGASDGFVRVFDIRTGEVISKWETPDKCAISRLCLNSGGTAVVCLNRNGALSMTDLHRSNEPIFGIPAHAHQQQHVASDHGFQLNSGNLVQDPNNTNVFMACCPAFGSDLVRVDTETASAHPLPSLHDSVVTTFDWAVSSSSTKPWMLSASQDKSLKIFQ